MAIACVPPTLLLRATGSDPDLDSGLVRVYLLAGLYTLRIVVAGRGSVGSASAVTRVEMFATPVAIVVVGSYFVVALAAGFLVDSMLVATLKGAFVAGLVFETAFAAAFIQRICFWNASYLKDCTTADCDEPATRFSEGGFITGW